MQVLTDLKRCFSRVQSRGTGPRATGPGGVFLSMRRSGSGAPELQALGYACARGGQAPTLRAREGFASPCAVREQAIPNYSLLLLILLIVIIL